MSIIHTIFEMLVGFVAKYLETVFFVLGINRAIESKHDNSYEYDVLTKQQKGRRIEECLKIVKEKKGSDNDNNHTYEEEDDVVLLDDDSDNDDGYDVMKSTTSDGSIDLWELRELALSKGGLLEGKKEWKAERTVEGVFPRYCELSLFRNLLLIPCVVFYSFSSFFKKN
jgi:hypothetical protein